MSKMNLFLTSLVSAVPAAILSVLLAIKLLSAFGEMPGAFVGLASVTFLVSAFVAVLPVGIVLFGGKTDRAPKPPKVEKSKASKKDEQAAADDEGDELVDADEPEVEVSAATSVSTSELDVIEGQFTEDNIPAFDGPESSDGVEAFAEADEDDEEFDGFEIPDEDDEEFV